MYYAQLTQKKLQDTGYYEDNTPFKTTDEVCILLPSICFNSSSFDESLKPIRCLKIIKCVLLSYSQSIISINKISSPIFNKTKNMTHTEFLTKCLYEFLYHCFFFFRLTKHNQSDFTNVVINHYH